jgi:hypothetical protein
MKESGVEERDEAQRSRSLIPPESRPVVGEVFMQAGIMIVA